MQGDAAPLGGAVGALALGLVVATAWPRRAGAVASGRPRGPGRARSQVTGRPPPRPPPPLPRLRRRPTRIAAGGRWVPCCTTTCGDITLELDGRSAPATVASFVSLARAGYWTDSVCHRLTTQQAPTGVLQCGDPTGRGLGDPGYDLPLENVPRDGHYVRGRSAWRGGRRHPSTSGEFFIVHRAFTLPPRRTARALLGGRPRWRWPAGGRRPVAAGGGEDSRPDGPPFASISVLTVLTSHRG